MKAMPRIWLDYAKFLGKQQLITRTRKTYDQALKSLPVTQHQLIWSVYLDWATSLAETCPETARAAYKRYIYLKPEKALDYLDFLLAHDLLEEALRLYIELINNDAVYLAKSDKNKFDLTLELC